ncbi:MAG: hydrogenase maturation nickel metallochaperone HypA/HybF, partial [Planctomycetota bacterium]
IVTSHAAEAGGGRVTGIHLVIGALSGIAPECVSFYWDIVSRGTCAEGAEIHVRHVPLAFACHACGASFESKPDDFACTSCGSLQVRVTAGSESHLEAIDLEPEATPVPRR